jgi:hypothetical protein
LEDDDRHRLLRCDRVDAPFVFDQPINRVSFAAGV